MVLYRIITVGSTKFDLFQHCLFLLVVKVKNYISITSTFTDYKNEKIGKQKRLFYIAVVTEPAKADSVTGNFETQGSKFSNETRSSEAACVLAIFRKVYKKFFISLGPSPFLS